MFALNHIYCSQAGISFVIIQHSESQLITVWCQETQTHDGKVNMDFAVI